MCCNNNSKTNHLRCRTGNRRVPRCSWRVVGGCVARICCCSSSLSCTVALKYSEFWVPWVTRGMVVVEKELFRKVRLATGQSTGIGMRPTGWLEGGVEVSCEDVMALVSCDGRKKRHCDSTNVYLPILHQKAPHQVMCPHLGLTTLCLSNLGAVCGSLDGIY